MRLRKITQQEGLKIQKKANRKMTKGLDLTTRVVPMLKVERKPRRLTTHQWLMEA